MSDCCATDESCAVPAEQAVNTAVSANLAEGACPSCGKKGKTVDTQIVKAMLTVSLEVVRPSASYRFCRTESCPVVYYGDEAGQVFTGDQLRERGGEEHPLAGMRELPMSAPAVRRVQKRGSAPATSATRREAAAWAMWARSSSELRRNLRRPFWFRCAYLVENSRLCGRGGRIFDLSLSFAIDAPFDFGTDGGNGRWRLAGK